MLHSSLHLLRPGSVLRWGTEANGASADNVRIIHFFPFSLNFAYSFFFFPFFRSLGSTYPCIALPTVRLRTDCGGDGG